LLVEIWSDIACPWCAIGRARFATALDGFAHADEVEVRWRSFELDPTLPATVEGDYVDRLARKYRVPERDAQTMIDRMTSVAAAEGLDFRFDRIRPGNTFDAHRLVHLGASRGRQHEVKSRFLTGYLEEGEPIGDHAALTRLAVQAGLDEVEITEMLTGDRFADAVREDEATAREYGINGVPFFVFDRTFGISGAQDPATIRATLERAWDESRGPLQMASVPGGTEHDHGDACTDGSCAV